MPTPQPLARRGVGGPDRWVRRSALALLVAGLAGLLVVGPHQALRPRLVPPGAATAAPGFPGFGEATLAVAPGPTLVGGGARCVLVADTPAARSKGLMGVGRLGAYAGMAFVWPAPTDAAFYMAGTTVALSIAWFGADGRYLAQADLAPCLQAAATCPQTRAPAPYRLALEVPRGGLAGLGIGPGAVVALGGPC